jgi:hypothetical protein
MNHKLRHFRVEENSVQVSLAILPRDHFAPEDYPIGRIQIYLKGQQRPTVKNISGFYTFLNLANRTYTAGVKSQYYFPKEFEVTIPSFSSPPGGDILSDDEDNQLRDYHGVLVANISLKPNPAYPFPGSSSLVRGIVKDAVGNPVADAIVRVVGEPIHTRTTEKGEYVLYFTRLTIDDIVKINGQKFIKANGTQTIEIEASHPVLGISPSFSLQVEEGTTTTVNILYT